MEDVNRWYLTKEELASTPSRKSGIDVNKELSYRQQAANFIQDMGQRLQVSQLCINTAIVYMHRFYVFHSFSEVHRNGLSVAALFLAAKLEEQPRKLEHVIKVAHVCLHKDSPPLDVRTEAYSEKQFEVVAHENVLLQTLGFVLAIEHPHTYVVKVCQLVKASKDLAQTSYFMATTSLHMTTMCLQYKPTVVACVCIHLACKWSSWKIEPCSEGKEWYYYVDKTVTIELLETLTQEFVAILETSPHRFKKKFIAQKDAIIQGQKNALEDSSKHHSFEIKNSSIKKEASSPGPSTSTAMFTLSSQPDDSLVPQLNVEKSEKLPEQSSPKKNKIAAHSISIDVYREKKEKERQELKSVPLSVEPPQLQQPTISKASSDRERPHVEKAVKKAVSPWAQPYTSALDFETIPKNAVSPLQQPSLTKALHDLERVHKTALNAMEPHLREKSSKSSVSKEQHQVHSTSVNKMNHHLPKIKSESAHSKESKSNLLKIPSGDPVVVLERVDVKQEAQGASGSEGVSVAQHPTHEKVVSVHKYPTQGENVSDPKESLPAIMTVTSSPVIVSKSKHPKHKTNSLHNSHTTIAQPLPHKLSPIKDLKTNGSKETDPIERRHAVIENHVGSSKSNSSKHERREKHKSKHSSKDKSISNHSEHSNPAIKVKIRKDIINLPEKNPLPVTHETPQKTIKIKLPKPPVTESATPTSIKLVITKDKSGSGKYSTSHKNDRESSKKRPLSHDSNYTSSKHAKYDHHAHSSHTSMKQSKNRHSSSRNTDHASSNDVSGGGGKRHRLVNDSTTGYLNVDVETYSGQPYYSGNQYFPYQNQTPPPPIPGLRIKTNSNPPLPPPLPPPPPPPQ